MRETWKLQYEVLSTGQIETCILHNIFLNILYIKYIRVILKVASSNGPQHSQCQLWVEPYFRYSDQMAFIPSIVP